MDQLEFTNSHYIETNNLICQVTKQLIKIKKQILDKFDLTCSQFEILSAAYQFSKIKDEIIQVDLSEKTQIDPMTTSTILRNLQKKGLITRTRNLINTRTIIIELTTKGEDVYIKALSEVGKAAELIYQNNDDKLLISQLLILSDKLNKLNP